MKLQHLTAALIGAALTLPIASHAADVKSTNSANVDSGKPTAFVKDSVITTKIKSRLAAEKLRTLANVSVDTDANGMVMLSGTTEDKATADKAESIARSTDGVTNVQNKIVVKKN